MKTSERIEQELLEKEQRIFYWEKYHEILSKDFLAERGESHALQ